MAVTTGTTITAPQQGTAKRLAQFFHPIATSEEVTHELKVFPLLGEEILVYRSLDGEAVAFRDLCIHRGTRLSLGELSPDGNVRCPYHGWEYDGTGRCVRIPALPEGSPIPSKARAFRYHAKERYGVIWVAIEDPLADVPAYPENEWDDPDWRPMLVLVQEWKTSAGRALENFCDWAHLPWVHENVLGTRDRAVTPVYDIWQTDLQMGHTIEEELGPDDIYGAKLTRNVFTINLPFSVHLDRGETETGNRTYISMSVAPITPDTSKLYVWNVRNHSKDPDLDDSFRDFSLGVFAQDKRIVESQRPEMIPLSLRDELHLKVPDAFALVYRRLLSDFGEEGDRFLAP